MARPAVLPTHVVETCLYAVSKPKSDEFYQEVLGLTPSLQTERITVYPLGATTLILFQIGLTLEDIHPDPDKYTIPKHGPTPGLIERLQLAAGCEIEPHMLRQHFCLGLPSREDVLSWEAFFHEKGVQILGVMDWERGGRSVYFADPDGNPGELASPGVWPHY